MKIKEICEYGKKSKIKAGEGLSEGNVKFFTSSSESNKYVNEEQFNSPGIIMGTGGNATLHYCDEPFSVSTDCVVLFPKIKISTKYLYYFFMGNFHVLQSGFKGAGLKHTSKKYIDEISLNHIPINHEQLQIVNILDNVNDIIFKKQQQLQEYDQLIKSRFVEMFGDVSQKGNGFTLKDVCEKMVRGPFGSSLKKEYFVSEGSTTYKVYEQKHAINREINIGNYYIDSQKFNELKRFEVKPGDIIMSCSGTIGKFFVIPINAKPGIINQALLNFKLNESLINHEYFLQSMYLIISTIESKGSGIANITSVNNIKKTNLFLPALTEQNKFSDFVQQVDKLKFAVQQSLNETQQLFDALMQEYFG